MKFYKNFVPPDKKIEGSKNNRIDNNIYTFDIETSSFLNFNNKIYPAIYYDKLNEKEKEQCEFLSCMYIWQFGINDTVYYGRTWEQLKEFLNILDDNIPEKKILFIHNLSFEFHYLQAYFKFDNVMARKSRKVMKCEFSEFNIECRCSLMMSNVSLENLSNVFNLDIEKQVGSLEYELIRHSNTPLDKKEMKYCEYDCLVVYEYIKKELSVYKRVDKIPFTSTGHVRRELKNTIKDNYNYKRRVKKAININPYVYNRLIDCFMGGYTHANRIYTDEIIKNVDSYDFTSSYPYVMTTSKFPSTEFKRCKLNNLNDMVDSFAYILKIKFYNVRSLYHNTFISKSKCKNIQNGVYDNGRIIKADSFEMTLTDIDFKLLHKCYNFKYKIIESWYAVYKYLPIEFIRFILEKYKMKTEYKGIEEKSTDYALAKSMVNSLYGMTVTNTIKDEVIYKDGEWEEIPLTNEEIQEKLLKLKSQAFLEFSWGVWVTAIARKNLIENVIKLDDYAIYMDTDSIKLSSGYNKKVIEDYNKSVLEKIKNVSNLLKIDESLYSPTDIKGKKHTLGLFDYEGQYQEFITQGAKKYAFIKDNKIGITVAGVPKKGAKALKSLDDFRDNFIFKYEDTGKNLLAYIEEQKPIKINDYLGNEYLVTDKKGICFLPCTYELSKSEDYSDLISDESSKRSRFKED